MKNWADKFGKLLKSIPDGLLNPIKNAVKKLTQALEEENIDFDDLNCLDRDILNFDLVEDDIKGIHRRLELRGATVLGSHLILDDKKELMEIKTYSKKGEKKFVNTVECEVKRVINIPADILAEMKSKGRIELSLKLDN